MISFENHLGKIQIKEAYFEKLIGNAVSSCYGVSKMVPKGFQKVSRILSGKLPEDSGIKVKGNEDAIIVDLHINVIYGLNINAISRSIVNKVAFTVEHSTGIKVKKVLVHIDGMCEA
ncbi:MAG: Asp23/Gls24 family envelope stress response protein [Clostridia bacterium]|nr:Asp23/Gls24 family envelope stress response protein [Clostridia bacterium]